MNKQTEEFKALLDERDRVVRTLDVEGARKLHPGGYYADPDSTVLIALHKARYELLHMPAELRHASGAWLRERGYGRMTGGPLLPEGQLPE